MFVPAPEELNELKRLANDKNLEVMETERLTDDLNSRRRGPDHALAQAGSRPLVRSFVLFVRSVRSFCSCCSFRSVRSFCSFVLFVRSVPFVHIHLFIHSRDYLLIEYLVHT